jgi:hypothetical protein
VNSIQPGDKFWSQSGGDSQEVSASNRPQPGDKVFERQLYSQRFSVSPSDPGFLNFLSLFRSDRAEVVGNASSGKPRVSRSRKAQPAVDRPQTVSQQLTALVQASQSKPRSRSTSARRTPEELEALRAQFQSEGMSEEDIEFLVREMSKKKRR